MQMKAPEATGRPAQRERTAPPPLTRTHPTDCRASSPNGLHLRRWRRGCSAGPSLHGAALLHLTASGRAEERDAGSSDAGRGAHPCGRWRLQQMPSKEGGAVGYLSCNALVDGLLEPMRHDLCTCMCRIMAPFESSCSVWDDLWLFYHLEELQNALQCSNYIGMNVIRTPN